MGDACLRSNGAVVPRLPARALCKKRWQSHVVQPCWVPVMARPHCADCQREVFQTAPFKQQAWPSSDHGLGILDQAQSTPSERSFGLGTGRVQLLQPAMTCSEAGTWHTSQTPQSRRISSAAGGWSQRGLLSPHLPDTKLCRMSEHVRTRPLLLQFNKAAVNCSARDDSSRKLQID